MALKKESKTRKLYKCSPSPSAPPERITWIFNDKAAFFDDVPKQK